MSVKHRTSRFHLLMAAAMQEYELLLARGDQDEASARQCCKALLEDQVFAAAPLDAEEKPAVPLHVFDRPATESKSSDLVQAGGDEEAPAVQWAPSASSMRKWTSEPKSPKFKNVVFAREASKDSNSPARSSKSSNSGFPSNDAREMSPKSPKLRDVCFDEDSKEVEALDGEYSSEGMNSSEGMCCGLRPWIVERWVKLARGISGERRNYVLHEFWDLAVHRGSSSKLKTLRPKLKRNSNFSVVSFTDVLRGMRAADAEENSEKSLSSTGSSYMGMQAMSCMMHPDSLVRVAWSLVGFAFLTLDVFFLTMGVFGFERAKWLELLDGAYWAVDIIVNFRIGTLQNGEVDMSPRIVAKAYVKGWFLFDFALVLYQWGMSIREMLGTESSTAGAIRYTRFARFLKLLRLTKLQVMVTQVMQRVQNIYVMLTLRLFVYMSGMMFYVHVSASAFFTLGRAHATGWVYRYEGIFLSWPQNYIGSVMWAVTQLQGSAEVMPGNLQEREFSVAHYIVSVIVLALFVSRLTTVMQAIQEVGAEKRKLVNSAYTYMKKHNISSDLCIWVQRYLKEKDSKSRSDPEEASLLSCLPQSLRQALLREVRWPVIGGSLLMKSFERACKTFTERLFCELLQPQQYSAGDRVFQQGLVCNKVYFVVSGAASYLHWGPILTLATQLLRGRMPDRVAQCYEVHRRDHARRVKEVGTAFCEFALFVNWVTLGDLEVDGLLPLSVFVLDSVAFEQAVITSVQIQSVAVEHAQLVVETLSRQKVITDLNCSGDILVATKATAIEEEHSPRRARRTGMGW